MHLYRGYIGNQPDVNDWGFTNKQISTKNARVHALVLANRSAATTWFVQIFDSAAGAAGSVDGSGIPRYDLPLPAGEVLTLQDSQFNTGLFVRVVTTAGGSTLISTTDIKCTTEYLVWPLSNA